MLIDNGIDNLIVKAFFNYEAQFIIKDNIGLVGHMAFEKMQTSLKIMVSLSFCHQKIM